MPQVALRVDLVTHSLLEYLGFREPAISLALPDLHTIARDSKRPTGRRLQRDLAQIVGKRAEQLLSEPRGPQKPLALGAIGDDDFGFDGRHILTLIPQGLALKGALSEYGTNLPATTPSISLFPPTNPEQSAAGYRRFR